MSSKVQIIKKNGKEHKNRAMKGDNKKTHAGVPWW